MPSAGQSLLEIDSLEIHVLVNDEIDQISPSPNPLVKHTQSFAGVPLSPVPDPAARGGAKLEMPMRNICCVNSGKADDSPVVVALPPNRPDYRGVMFDAPVSLEPDPTLQEIQDAGGNIEVIDQGRTVLDGMFFISGDIPRETSYEGGIPGGIRYSIESGKWTKDELIMEERYVMCNIKGKGLVIFTGCSHAGLINIAKNAKEITNNPIHSIVGGYHLADASPEKMSHSMRDLKELKPALLMPGHCTGWRFKGLIENQMPGQMAPIFGGIKYVL
ncbi:hypothetical protein SAPIO_CDS1565 [Scedosporium apiospermum]|uniref:Metallo-beta-lactamase domain-containing protein n=1 Tax=Pseudallescheria apiosperma TaxID=563466 RepID=A0A084GEK0_PSEDA|nr:uncharacterized protein SAPIO_CDS1565 [Scedosporium apiospermum]KEZ45762.1 hypothetical protein SAPIO_CDS1565 [Scedosporium apiospermum]